MDILKARATLATVMLVTLLGSAGVALPYPVLSPYFMNESSNPLVYFMGWDAKILLGIALATYPLGLLIGSNVIGSLSDRYGRKKVLVYSLIGSVLGYVATGLAVTQGSYLFFIVARLITGFFEGNISIARAIAVELHPQIDRSRALSLLYSTGYAGWLIGPLAGGYLMDYGVDMTFYIGGLAVLLSLLLVLIVLEKSVPQKSSGLSIWQEITQNHSATLLRIPHLRQFLWYYFVFTLGINAFYEFYPLWLVEELDFNSKQIGWTTVIITSVMVFVSSTVADKLPRRFGEKRSLLFGTIVFGSAVIVTTQLIDPYIYLPLALTGACIAVINVIFPSMLSEYFGHLGQGKVMGLQVSIFCFTNVVISIVGSFIALISATTTLFTASALILCSVFLFKKPENHLIVEEIKVAT